RPPTDPAGLGDGARKLARETRLRLGEEHTGGASPDTMIDPEEWFDTLRRSARSLDEWHHDGARGPRPPGHLRTHEPDRVHAAPHGLLHWVHSHILDPDGRPRRLRRH